MFGAHLRGQPLNVQLAGARFAGEVRTAPEYRMVLVPGVGGGADRPGIVHAGAGVSLPGERWVLSPAALGQFLAALPAPMALGRIVLDDGTTAVGFHCDHVTAETSSDITSYGGWRNYLSVQQHPSPERQLL